jgi:rhodanese-related sulfurtransferase
MSKKRNPSKIAPPRRALRRQNPAWLWIGLGVVFLAAVVLWLFQSQSAPTEISAAQAYEKLQQGVFFLDVRTQEEWNQERIAKSTLIPLDQLSGRLNELPRDQDIVVVCASGARSKSGAIILRQAGFSRAVSMINGLLAWKMAGYPLDSSNP